MERQTATNIGVTATALLLVLRDYASVKYNVILTKVYFSDDQPRKTASYIENLGENIIYLIGSHNTAVSCLESS